MQWSGDVSIEERDDEGTVEAVVRLAGGANRNLEAAEGSVLQTGAGGVSTDSGDVTIDGLDGASVARVGSDSGEVIVRTTNGGFEVPAATAGPPPRHHGDPPGRVQAVVGAIPSHTPRAAQPQGPPVGSTGLRLRSGRA